MLIPTSQKSHGHCVTTVGGNEFGELLGAVMLGEEDQFFQDDFLANFC